MTLEVRPLPPEAFLTTFLGLGAAALGAGAGAAFATWTGAGALLTGAGAARGAAAIALGAAAGWAAEPLLGGRKVLSTLRGICWNLMPSQTAMISSPSMM